MSKILGEPKREYLFLKLSLILKETLYYKPLELKHLNEFKILNSYFIDVEVLKDLSRNNTTLFSSNLTLKKIINERMHPNLKALKDPNFFFFKTGFRFG
jgi:hypothetical protein